eukprot:gene22536-27040_t
MTIRIVPREPEHPARRPRRSKRNGGKTKLTNLDLDTESIAEFATRLGTVADNVAQARQDAAGGDHLALSTVLGLIGGDFVDVASRAQQAHIDDIDRLSAVISSVHRTLMIDVDALARPIIDLVDTVGTGVPSTNGPDVGIRIATDALEIAYQLGSAALSELASSQSSSTALTAAVTKTEQTQTSTRNLADRGTDIAGVVDEATTSVYAGMTELGEILQSFLTLAIKAGPTLMTPTGQLMLLSAALEHLGRAVSVIERVRGELAGSTDKMSALVPSVPIPDPAPGVSESAGGSGSASGSGSVGGSGSASGSGSVGGVEVELPDGSIATAPNAEAAAAVRNALTQQGVPYAWGGTTPGVGLDCSGLTQWAYGQAGVDIPRLAQEQGIGNQVDQNNLMPGDLAVWDGHVAMVIGGGQMIEAGDPVEISAIRTTNSGMGFHGFYPVAVNRAGTIAVRATEHAVPVDLRISQDELRYGGQRLAQQILTLYSKAAIEAGARHRVELEETGVPAAILDRLGLPTRDELADVDAAEGQNLPEIDRIMELAKHRTGLLQDAVDGVGALRVVVSSEGGIVTATVDGLGALVDLRITDAITAMNSQTVAALTVATIHQAVQQSNDERERLVSELRVALKQT